MSLQQPENASPVKINELTVASIVQATDITVIVQNGVTKQVTAALFTNAITGAFQQQNATLSALAALSAPTGYLAFLSAGNISAFTLTGTIGELTVTNGQGSGTPTFSLPAALIFTGKTVSGGTFHEPVIFSATINSAIINGGTISGLTTLNVTTITATTLGVTGNATISGNTTIVGNLTASGTITLPQFLSSAAPSGLAPTASAGVSLIASRSDHAHQFQLEEFVFAASDETTALTTGTAKITFTTVLGRLLTSVQANLTTANSANVVSGPLTIDMNLSGQSIFGAAKLVVSNGSTTSRNAATQPTFSATVVPPNSIWTLDIDNTGSAASATGLKVTFVWRQNT